MGKIFKFLFIYVLFFNVIFWGTSESMAASFKDSMVGPRDRVRSFINNEIDFKYNKNSGFSCRPAGLKSYPDINSYSSAEDYKNKISGEVSNTSGIFDKDLGLGILTYLESMFFDIFLQPIFCITFLEGLMESGSFAGKGKEDNKNNVDNSETSTLLGNMTGVLKTIISVVGVSAMSDLIKMVLGEDDYNIDPTNPYCMGYYATEMVTCLISLLIWKLDIKFGNKILIILGINTAYYAAKMIASEIIFHRAQAAFEHLSLCGDDWNVYGDLGLQETLEEEIVAGSMGLESGARNIKNIGLSYLKKYYPSKGAFFGSRQYLLDECFLNRNKEVCRKIFNLGDNIEITNNTIDNNSTIIQKAYREFKYGGVEFAFNTNNGDCIDPRPERAGYLGTPDSTSQLYYFRGSEPANFACDRFLIRNTPEYKSAYRCCLEASQKLICIANKETSSSGKEVILHTMCSKNTTCSVKSNINIESEREETGYGKIKCEDIKKSLESGGLSPDIVKKHYDNFCDETGKLKPVYGYEYSVEDDGKGSKVAGAGRIEFKIRQSIYDENKYCVETYNLCPYNFKLMGGSEQFGDEFKQTHEENIPVKKVGNVYEQKTLFKKLTEENEVRQCSFTKGGVKECYGACHSTTTGAKGVRESVYESCFNRASNFCQIDRHCTTLTPLFEREKLNTSPYVDEACINLVGSSHNYDNYERVTNRPRNSFFLTAPVVECVVETAKNVLMNKAGHTKCKNAEEEPIRGSCPDTGELYKKGEILDEDQYQAPFHRLRRYFVGITKALMALAVVFYGYSSLFFGKGFSSTEEVMKFILKLITVAYFSTTTGWINPIFNGVYAVYGEVSQLAVKLAGEEADYDSNKYSGCYFIRSKYISNNYEDYGDRSYISLFDTLDCKLSRYFGFYVNSATNPPILSMILAGVFTFGIAIILILPLLLLFVSLLYFIASVVLSFIVSSFTITLLLLITPIMIPQILFDRTKDNVKKWLKAIVRNIFSPLFLVMGMFMFFTIFDKYFVGDAVFNGSNEPIRNVFCGVICKMGGEQFAYVDVNNLETHIDKKLNITYSGSEAVNCENNLRGKIVDLSRKSLICILQKSTKQSTNTGISIINFIVDDFKGFPGLFLQAGAFFSCFLDIMFLLIVVFIFNQFIPYINKLTNIIFSGEGGEIDDKLTITLNGMMQSIAKKGAMFANKTKDYGGRIAINKGINRFNEWRDRRIGGPGDKGKGTNNKDDIKLGTGGSSSSFGTNKKTGDDSDSSINLGTSDAGK